MIHTANRLKIFAICRSLYLQYKGGSPISKEAVLHVSHKKVLYRKFATQGSLFTCAEFANDKIFECNARQMRSIWILEFLLPIMIQCLPDCLHKPLRRRRQAGVCLSADPQLSGKIWFQRQRKNLLPSRTNDKIRQDTDSQVA